MQHYMHCKKSALSDRQHEMNLSLSEIMTQFDPSAHSVASSNPLRFKEVFDFPCCSVSCNNVNSKVF